MSAPKEVDYYGCALHALEVQLEGLSPLTCIRTVTGLLLKLHPMGKTFVLCDECAAAIQAGGPGQCFHVEPDRAEGKA